MKTPKVLSCPYFSSVLTVSPFPSTVVIVSGTAISSAGIRGGTKGGAVGRIGREVEGSDSRGGAREEGLFEADNSFIGEFGVTTVVDIFGGSLRKG